MNTCTDCKFYLPVDVFKGICKLSKKEILPDDSICDKAEKVAKCKFCSQYTAEKDYLGNCMSTTLAYPDMNAAKCADFEWIRQN
ncbi:MAG: 4-hydroxyphenylacetate decarboxylase small subunit [Bacteroidetes bacterium]|nr:4-hydroxyphenylacetate decarboxylase small subunit [Bacteroidota bacterium]